MNTAFLLIGGNVGNREENFEWARKLITQYGGFIEQSSCLYDTAPWGKIDQPSFLNQAVEIKNCLDSGTINAANTSHGKIDGTAANREIRTQDY
jgi:2-amino-4-hydroxy-6-hydroxymethyldihydropteridine diphosphokinase